MICIDSCPLNSRASWSLEHFRLQRQAVYTFTQSSTVYVIFIFGFQPPNWVSPVKIQLTPNWPLFGVNWILTSRCRPQSGILITWEYDPRASCYPSTPTSTQALLPSHNDRSSQKRNSSTSFTPLLRSRSITSKRPNQSFFHLNFVRLRFSTMNRPVLHCKYTLSLPQGWS